MRERIQRAIDDLVASGNETGSQVAVLSGGAATVDAAAGRAAPDGPPVTPGTLFYAASTGKGVAVTLALTSDIPSAGTMSARGVARMHAALLCHVPGPRLVSPSGWR